MSDPQVIPLLCEWTRPDKPRRARPAAIRAAARVTKNIYLDEQATELIVEALTAALNDSGYRVRWAAASALGSLSEPARARSALGTLRALAANDPRERVRRAAERTIEAIEKGEPAQVGLDEVRDELKEIVEKNEELTDRLDRLEVREPATQPEPESEEEPASAP